VEIADIFVDAYTRIKEGADAVLEGLGEAELTFRADAEANSIAWLVWHMTRVEDDKTAHGYGHTSEEVAQVRLGADFLRGYRAAVSPQTLEYVKGLKVSDLDRVVDRRWDPPVTLGVRLVSVIDDEFQHIGQAAFVRGLVLRGATGS
jgi:hypothetical protein